MCVYVGGVQSTLRCTGAVNPSLSPRLELGSGKESERWREGEVGGVEEETIAGAFDLRLSKVNQRERPSQPIWLSRRAPVPL